MPCLRSLSAIIGVAVYGATLGCTVDSQPQRVAADMSELWEAPADLEQRDLFYGPGGKALAPDTNARFALKKLKDHGRNAGYTVVDDQGREWSAKLGVESRVEVTVSRIVWAVGYHQPSVYHVRRWILSDSGRLSAQQPARFRLEDATMRRESEWSWRENPFLGTRQFAGLFALMILFNNWDLKAQQNSVYHVGDDSATAKRRYVVRDLGAALGKSGRILVHTKDDLDGFEAERFITGVNDSLVEFAFTQSWRDPLGQHIVKVADLRWICGLLQRLSLKQWHDAFRAGGFSDAEAERYIRRLQTKIAEGLAITA